MNLSKNEVLRTEIAKRMRELDMKQSFLINDAQERGYTLQADRFSKYLKGKSGGLGEEAVLWVATRLGIYVNINFGELVNRNGKLRYEITKYNESAALQRLKTIFNLK